MTPRGGLNPLTITMSLNKLRLFSNVRITPDYSVVHDMDPVTWSSYLINPPNTDTDPPVLLYTKEVNFYRLPDSIRIEANYDSVRKATYGYLETIPELDVTTPSFGKIFFWVNDVRLVTQKTRTDEGTILDTVLLDVSVDVWSTYGQQFALYDSFVERRHMPRWKNTGTELSPIWKPIYYANAGQGVEGAYELETTEDMSPPLTFAGYNDTFDPRFIVVFAIDDQGEANIYIGIDVETQSDFVPVYHDYANGKKFFGVQQLLDGSFYDAAGANVSAEFIQSITVVPYLAGLKECIQLRFAGGQFYLDINEVSPLFSDFSAASGSSGLSWITLNFGMERLYAMMQHIYSTPTVTGPSKTTSVSYTDSNEPMMYLSPARIRKTVTAFGGEIFTVPDIAAFEKDFTLQNIFDMTSAITYVFAGTDIQEANAIGALGVVEAATLPIFNSAWRSYEAINKVGDEISFNAKQMQAIGGGLTNAGLSAAGGFLMGGPAGAILGLAGGVTGTALNAYGNAEELRAKQTTIKNSPCVVKSGGSGLGAYVKGYTDIFYITLKMDEQSLEKLRFMYYWFGYFVNRTFKGEVSLHTRSKFDFIKTNGAKVKGDLTASAAKQIATIFDSGVTIYHGSDGYREIGTGNMIANDEV